MKSLFDKLTEKCSKLVTNTYSTSFSNATALLHPSIRNHIYNIYGFTRLADEIVDTFHKYPKEELLKRFSDELDFALKERISLNPILNAFQQTVHHCAIEKNLITTFLKSMKWDLYKKSYDSETDYNNYILGSAKVVALMCLKVFVEGNEEQYHNLKEPACALGAAFQKVNFLRDIEADYKQLNRFYFPNTTFEAFNEQNKTHVLNNIEKDFSKARVGIKRLPKKARFAVYLAYNYYWNLLNKIKQTHLSVIKKERIRLTIYQKFAIFAKSFINYHVLLLFSSR